MSDAIPVHCRNCREPLDVYQPFADRFCCEECEDALHALANAGEHEDAVYQRGYR